MIKPRKPLVEYVDFIDPGRTFTGLKVYPVRQGMCKLDGNQISLWLEFPQSMTRGDSDGDHERLLSGSGSGTVGSLFTPEYLAPLFPLVIYKKIFFDLKASATATVPL